MPNNKIKVIVFDLGNVLVPFDFQKAFDALNKIEPGLGDTFSQKYFANFHFHEGFEKAEISLNEFTSQMLTWLDHKISEQDFVSTSISLIDFAVCACALNESLHLM